MMSVLNNNKIRQWTNIWRIDRAVDGRIIGGRLLPFFALIRRTQLKGIYEVHVRPEHALSLNLNFERSQDHPNRHETSSSQAITLSCKTRYWTGTERVCRKRKQSQLLTLNHGSKEDESEPSSASMKGREANPM